MTKQNRLIIRRFKSNPFRGSITTDAVNPDERDWNAFVTEKREQFNDPMYDPLRFSDKGGSVTDWMNKDRG